MMYERVGFEVDFAAGLVRLPIVIRNLNLNLSLNGLLLSRPAVGF